MFEAKAQEVLQPPYVGKSVFGGVLGSQLHTTNPLPKTGCF